MDVEEFEENKYYRTCRSESYDPELQKAITLSKKEAQIEQSRKNYESIETQWSNMRSKPDDAFQENQKG